MSLIESLPRIRSLRLPRADGLIQWIVPLAIVSLGFRQTPTGDSKLGLPRATRRDDKEWLHLHDPEHAGSFVEATGRDGVSRPANVPSGSKAARRRPGVP